jgi:precorrin-4/cobalt-precorrin-4 C11-methyltransferase
MPGKTFENLDPSDTFRFSSCTKACRFETGERNMIVHFVGAGPGDPELLTRKAERLLGDCRICIYAGSLVSPGVLALLPDQAERHDSAGMSLDEVIAVCRNARDRGIDVVRLHSATPRSTGRPGSR